MKLLNQHVTALVLAAAFGACGSPESATKLKNTIASEEAELGLVTLGLPYDSLEDKFRSKSCITDGVSINERRAQVPNFIKSSFEVLNDASYETLSKTLSFDLSLSLGLQNDLDLTGAVNYSKTSASNARSITQSFISKATTEFITLDQEQISPEPSALAFLKRFEIDADNDGERDLSNEDIIQRRRKFCGDSFVSAVTYQASISGTIKLEFASEEDKANLSGSISIENNADGTTALTLAGGVSQLTEEERGSVKLTITGNQLGGSSEELLAFLPGETLTCDIDNAEPCLVAYDQLRTYAKAGFVEQLRNVSLGEIIPIAVETEAYDDSWTLFELSPDAFLWF
ncbi:MAG: hypothetical protein HRU19_06600 [Pseudobacteriovorax sp.]|nr:hypothetical protein [Pseudobacteriovorax sp.]